MYLVLHPSMSNPRVFQALTSDQNGVVDAGIRAEHVSSWVPSVLHHDHTVVNMLGGQTYILRTPFPEFHVWVIGPQNREVKPAPDAKASKRDLNGRTHR